MSHRNNVNSHEIILDFSKIKANSGQIKCEGFYLTVLLIRSNITNKYIIVFS